MTLVPLVLLSVTLAGPAPSGSTGTSRLCRGCSHPHRHLPARAAPSFTALLRQGRRSRSLTSTRIISASRRTRRRLKNDPGAPREFCDLGADFYDNRVRTERRKREHIRQLKDLGYRVTLEPAA